MKTAILFHNPQAGAEDHNKEELVSQIKEKGYDCQYVSTKEKGWKKAGISTDLVVIAGGDGTVGKVLRHLSQPERGTEKKPAVAILPLGTANNIGRSLGINKNTGNAIDKWDESELKKLDIGRINGLGDTCDRFIESVGFGVFPALMRRVIKTREIEHENPKQEVKNALDLLAEVAKKYKARKCDLVVDGKDYSGKYLMVEIMNIKFVGPSLNINEGANMGDGLFEVVLITEDKRDELISFIQDRIENKTDEHSFRVVKGKEIQVKWKGSKMHIDDELLKMKTLPEIRIKPQNDALNVLLPQPVHTPQPVI